MTIKQTVRSEMPNVKRCRLEETDVEETVADEDQCPAPVSFTKKQKTDTEFVDNSNSGADFIDYNSVVSAWCTGVPCTPGSVPLLKSSRGRVSVRPSRFNDSLVGSWKKDNDNDYGLCNDGNQSLKKRGNPFCDREVSKKPCFGTVYAGFKDVVSRMYTISPGCKTLMGTGDKRNQKVRKMVNNE